MDNYGASRLTQYQRLLSAVPTPRATQNLSSSWTSLPRVSPCLFGHVPSWSSWLSISFPGSVCPFSPSLGFLSFSLSHILPFLLSDPTHACSIRLPLCSILLFSPCSRLFQMPVAVVSLTSTVKTFPFAILWSGYVLTEYLAKSSTLCIWCWKPGGA